MVKAHDINKEVSLVQRKRLHTSKEKIIKFHLTLSGFEGICLKLIGN